MNIYATNDDKNIKKERAEARRMRKTQWWLTTINKGECHYCNQIFAKDELTMDHIVPLSRGGKSTKGNIVAACKNCNNNKKSRTPVDITLDGNDINNNNNS